MDPTHGDFLKSIGQDWESDAHRLLFADWLDEQGDPRAELIRVQCQLEQEDLRDEVEAELRRREYELLLQCRPSWIDSLALPVKGVTIRRGVIDGVQISEWTPDVPTLLVDGRLATIRELDLTSLKLTTGEFGHLASLTEFPAVKKLFLGDNQLTELPAQVLSQAFPSLEVLYLFGNPLDNAKELAELLQLSHSNLQCVDIGECPPGYHMSPGETETKRRQFLYDEFFPFTERCFAKQPTSRSGTLFVAQYWDDEAHDAVHGLFLVGDSLEISIQEWEEHEYPENWDEARGVTERSKNPIWQFELWGEVKWFDNWSAIPIWASYSKEDSNQNQDYAEAYSPAMTIFRHGDYEMASPIRPWLDGVEPERGT